MEASVSNRVRFNLEGNGNSRRADCARGAEIIHSTEEREKESSVGSGIVDGGSLAGKESARVLSNIFSRVARTLPISVRRSSGSLAGSAEVMARGVIGVSTLRTQVWPLAGWCQAWLVPSLGSGSRNAARSIPGDESGQIPVGGFCRFL